MVFEEVCGSCGRFLETKYCEIRKINVCVDCCLLCDLRNKCNIRVWFYNLVPISTQKGTLKK